MTIWNIVLDGITLINLIMCIGFSVDFSAHFCYHYIDLKHKAGEKQEDTVERTLYSVSKPVIQVQTAALFNFSIFTTLTYMYALLPRYYNR